MSTLFDMEGTGVFAFRSVRIPLDNARPPRRALLSTYRLPWCNQFCFWLDEDTGPDIVFSRLQQGFVNTGGIPHNLLLRGVRPFASQSTPQLVWSRQFQRLCSHYHCHPAVCDRPIPTGTAWFKSIHTVIDSRDWSTVEDCQNELIRLAANLSQGPPDMTALLALPPEPMALYRDTPCRVASDGFLRYGGDYYSVPPYCIGRTVWVRSTSGERLLRVYSEHDTLVTQHARGNGQARVFLRLEHFGLIPPDQSELVRAWRTCFPEDDRFLSHLLAQRKLGAVQTLRTILSLTKQYRRKQLRAVFDTCERYNNYSHHFIQGVLQAGKLAATAASPATAAQGLLF